MPLLLELPFRGLGSESILAEDQDSAPFLRQLADLLKLPCLETESLSEARITLGPASNANNIPWKGDYPEKLGQIFWIPDSLQWHFSPGSIKGSQNLICSLLRRILDLAILPKVLSSTCLLLHGALLYLPERKQAVVLFGESGVGKSTACKRFRQQGGQALADDKLLLAFQPDGSILAQPLPTWSGFTERNISVDFSNAVPVGALLRLTRGFDDRIVPSDPIQWRLWLVSSFNTFLQFPPQWLPKDFQRHILEKEFPFADSLAKRFGKLTLEGDLKGRIFDSLNQLLS